MDQKAQSAIGSTLRQAFYEAQAKNPSYSLRSFAKRLAISPAALSEIMNGKRRISIKIAERIADRLALDPEQRMALLSLFGRAGASKKPPPTLKYEELDADQFAVMADWYHFAILSLMETTDFISDVNWISMRLHIRPQEVAAAIDRLERLGLIKRVRNALVLTKGRLTTSDGVRNLSLQKSHRKNLELAEKSLAEDDVEIRDFVGMTLAIAPEKLPEAKKMIRDFMDGISELLETPGKQREVYKLCLQLFPLSK